jgi:hypothetical protein
LKSKATFGMAASRVPRAMFKQMVALTRAAKPFRDIVLQCTVHSRYPARGAF